METELQCAQQTIHNLETRLNTLLEELTEKKIEAETSNATVISSSVAVVQHKSDSVEKSSMPLKKKSVFAKLTDHPDATIRATLPVVSMDVHVSLIFFA